MRACVCPYPETLQSAVGHTETASALSVSIPSTGFDSLYGSHWVCSPSVCIAWRGSILTSVFHLGWQDK